jgi:glycosyltransferase involved in cell wall biosynthesis
MVRPLVSVCIATYHQEAYIHDCIASVLQQGPDITLEILVGDDGSGTATADIVRALATQSSVPIRYFRHVRNLGPAANYQFLIAKAQGEFIAHLDGDDYWLPGKLRLQLGWLRANPDSPACYTNAMVVTEAGELIGGFSTTVHGHVDLQGLLSKGNFLNFSSMLYRAEFASLILALPAPFIDYRIHLVFAQSGLLGVLDAALVVYRRGTPHSMTSKTPEIVLGLYFDAVRFGTQDPLVPASLMRQALRHFWKGIVLEAMVKGRPVWAAQWGGKIGAVYPGSALLMHSYAVPAAVRDLVLLVWQRLLRRLCGRNALGVLHVR